MVRRSPYASSRDLSSPSARIPGSGSNETSDALRYIEGGHARGKVVVSLDGVTLNRSEHDATGGEVML